MRRALLCLFRFAVPFGIAVLGQAASAQTVWFVDADATGANTGTSWTDAFPDLQDALASAQDGDEIWVAEGLYTPTQDGDRTVSFVLPSGVGLYGGFAGTEANRDDRDWTLYESILSGDVGVPGDSLDNSYHVLTAIDVHGNTVFDGFTVQHGYANGPTSTDILGAGLYLIGGTLTIRHTRFRHNATRRTGSKDGGAGIYAEEVNLIVEDVAFLRNVAQDYGGSLYSVGGSVTLTRVTARADSAFLGASFYHTDGFIEATDCLISGASSRGGGNAWSMSAMMGTVTDCVIEETEGTGLFIFDGGSPRFIRTIIRDNFIDNGDGGGIYISSINGKGRSEPVFEDCLIENNVAEFNGGGVYMLGDATALFLHTTFWGNRAIFGSGGALRVNPEAVFLGCHFERNQAEGNGGAIAADGTVTIIGGTFVGNRSTFSSLGGGALSFRFGPVPGQNRLIANSVFVGNRASNGGAILAFGTERTGMVNVTLAGNVGEMTGGAIWADNAPGLEIQNSILHGNTAPDGSEVFIASGAPPMIAQSIVAGDYPSGTAILDTDPLFIRDPHPGPDGTWGSDDDDYGDLRLHDGSPAVDFGLAAYLPPDTWDLDGDGDTSEPLPIDLQGGARVLGASPDLGAYEGPVGIANEPVPDGRPGPGLRVYPNPSGGVLHIEAASQDGALSEVTITDVLGRVVYRTRTADGQVAVEVLGLAPGVYVVRAGGQSEVVTVRQ